MRSDVDEPAHLDPACFRREPHHPPSLILPDILFAQLDYLSATRAPEYADSHGTHRFAAGVFELSQGLFHAATVVDARGSRLGHFVTSDHIPL